MVQDGQKLQEMSITLVTVIIILSFILAGTIGLYISNTVRKPIKEIEMAIQKLAKENWKQHKSNIYQRMRWVTYPIIYAT